MLTTKLAFPSLNSFTKHEIFGMLLVKWAAIEASSTLKETPKCKIVCKQYLSMKC